MDTAGIVLLARSDSTRLPRKSLLDLCGRPVLAHQSERLGRSRLASRVVLATTARPIDDDLCRTAEQCGMKIYRGSTHDVVLRLDGAAGQFGLNWLVVAGGDDVFCDSEFVDRLIEEYRSRPADFITIDHVPFGTTPFGVRASAVRRVLDIRADDNTDGWERYFTETGLFTTRTVEPEDPLLRHPEIRLDLDYPEDYELIKAVYERLYTPGRVPELRRVLRLLVEEEPELNALNRGAHEKWLKNRAATWPPVRLKDTVARRPERPGGDGGGKA